MKIKDAKKPCKMGAGTRGLGRGALGAPGGAACFRLGVVLRAPAREGGEGSLQPRACRRRTSLPPCMPGELLPPPSRPSAPLRLLLQIWEVHGRLFHSGSPTRYSSCRSPLQVRAKGGGHGCQLGLGWYLSIFSCDFWISCLCP